MQVRVVIVIIVILFCLHYNWCRSQNIMSYF
jgi:hypothetical protein